MTEHCSAWCSTELNPDEMANVDIKQAITTLAPARTKLQLVKATARHLRSVSLSGFVNTSSMGQFDMPLDSSFLVSAQ